MHGDKGTHTPRPSDLRSTPGDHCYHRHCFNLGKLRLWNEANGLSYQAISGSWLEPALTPVHVCSILQCRDASFGQSV